MEEIPATELQDVGMSWLTRYRNIVAPKTTGRRLTSLRRFCRWAGWGELFADYNAPTPLKGQPHPLPEGIEGVKRMIVAANEDHHKALIALCGLMGLRIAEALAVVPSDIDFNDMILTVRGKGDKQRQVPISEFAWETMTKAVTRAFCEGGTPVVPLRDRHARALVTRLGVKAGLTRRVASHDLRATFATSVYDKTLDQRLVQDLLGHSSGTQTEVYIGRSTRQMREGVEL